MITSHTHRPSKGLGTNYGSPEHLEDGVLDIGPLEVRVLLFKLGDEVMAEHLKH